MKIKDTLGNWHILGETRETQWLDVIWSPGFDPRTEKGYYCEYCWNLNNVWTLVNYIVPIFISYFDKYTIVMITLMENR